MSHYYDYDENLEHNIQQLDFRYKNQHIHLLTDNGVFSKERVDYGTRVLLESIELDESVRTLLDVGCGYGPIGLSIKKVYPQINITMIDVNSRAIELAKDSAKHNNLNVIILNSNVYENISDRYDVILTNPPIRAGKEVVHRILKESIDHLNTNGVIYVVIQKKQGAPSAKKCLEEVFGNCTIINRDKGYYILKSVNV